MIRRLIPLCLVFAACRVEEAPVPKSTPPATSAALKTLALNGDPGKALSVHDAKASKEERILVEGRIQEVVKGFASFKLIDTSLDYCGAGGSMDDCSTPWDYCCIPKDEIIAATVLVEVREGGKIVKIDALPGLKLLDLVVVKGKRIEDEHGNVTVLADGWFRRERPELRDGLEWPE